MTVRVAVEGRLDLVVVQRLLSDHDLVAAPVRRARGRDAILDRLMGYNVAAEREPWLVLVDLDRDVCAAEAVQLWLPHPAARMTFRIAVRAVEAWLLADRGIARFLRVQPRFLPEDPDALGDPKRRLVQIVSEECRSSSVRSAIMRSDGSTRAGQRYNEFLAEFVSNDWDWRGAARRSDSLRRAVEAIARIGG